MTLAKASSGDEQEEEEDEDELHLVDRGDGRVELLPKGAAQAVHEMSEGEDSEEDAVETLKGDAIA